MLTVINEKVDLSKLYSLLPIFPSLINGSKNNLN